MHIADGILPVATSVGSFVVAGGLTAFLSTKIEKEDIPKISVTTAVLFVSSLFHIKLGPSSVHPLLGGISLLILGPKVFISVLVALFFQEVMFSHGGITALGVNAITMGGSALIVSLISIPILKNLKKPLFLLIYYFLVGFFALFLAGTLTILALLSAGSEVIEIGKALLGAIVPLAVIEGVLTIIVVQFIIKVKPEILYYYKKEKIK